MRVISPILLLLAVTSLFPAPARSGAALFIYPTLIVFEGDRSSAEITLGNRGDQTGTFEMSWADMTMTAGGGLVKVEGQAPWSLQSYVRYSPRRVTLAPSESQVIKIALRRGQDVAEGEYYSHFRVLTLNSEDLSGGTAAANDPAQGAAVTRRSLAEPVPLVIYPSIDARLTAIALKDGVMAGSLPRSTEVYYSSDLEINDRSILFASYAIVP